jgi:hypothetical protein
MPSCSFSPPQKTIGMKMKLITCLGLLGLVFLTACRKTEDNQIQSTIYKATGNIQQKLNEFKAAIGPLNTTPNAIGGRREVNWDGVPDTLLNKSLPFNFFNPVGNGANASLQRGLVYGEGDFQVSASKFSHLNMDAAAEFQAFSGTKVFANVTNFEWPVGFEVAGQSTPASVQSFGMIFSDVDVEGSVAIEFFEGMVSLGKYSVPAHDAVSSFSFLGVQFQNRNITSVKISHQGRLADGKKDISQGGTDDLIVIDDLIYSEPVKL